jgi:hypothetical protein
MPLRLRSKPPVFGFTGHITDKNAVQLAQTQLPQLEALVAIRRGMESTRRLLIVVAGICLLGGAALVVFAPSGKERVSYIVASALVVLTLGAIGVQEFRIKTVGIQIEAGIKAIEKTSDFTVVEDQK